MDAAAGLKQLESRLTLSAEKISIVKAKLEDLLFRAQKIAAAGRNNLVSGDTLYGYDLQNYRRDLRAFGLELETLPGLLTAMEHASEYDPAVEKPAAGVMRACARVATSLTSLHDMALLAHHHIRAADHKILAWSISQEIEEMARNCSGLPGAANKILIRCTTPPAAGGPRMP
jgi:hypothetical protein